MSNKNRMSKKITAAVICVLIAACLLCLQSCNDKVGGETTQSGFTGKSGEIAEPEEAAGTAASAESGATDRTASAAEEAAAAATAATAATAAPAAEEGEEAAAALSPGMMELKEHVQAELSEKAGRWSMYLYRLDTGEEFGVNEHDSMISASLIKLYIAGCYFEQIDKGVIADDYPNQLFTMISESNNGSTNTLIDVLGMDTINEFIREHGFEASLLQRKMLEKNGKENYTSTGDCGRVLREVYEGTYVSEEASARIMEAMRAQIARNRYKIPAGVPEGIQTANKTGELFTTDENGVNVTIQNDAAIIFVDNHPYVLTVMTAVPSAGEGEMHSQIAALSSEVYEAVIIEEPGEENTEEDAEENSGSVAGTDEQDASSGETGSETGGTIEEAPAAEGDTESVSEDAPVSLPEPAEK